MKKIIKVQAASALHLSGIIVIHKGFLFGHLPAQFRDQCKRANPRISYLAIVPRVQRLTQRKLNDTGVRGVVINLHMRGAGIFSSFFCDDTAGIVILLQKNRVGRRNY